MLGGYNIATLVELLDDEQLATDAAKELTHTLLMFDAFHDVAEKADKGNPAAQQVLQSWADAEWFTSKEEIPEKLTVAVFKVPGETNTDDLSPAQDAWSRPDIPLHAKAMYKNPREGVTDAEAQITELEKPATPSRWWATSWEPAHHVNLPPIPCFGTSVTISPISLTNEMVGFVSQER